MEDAQMALLAWNDTFSVKVRQFDDQHKKLIVLINQLHDAMRVGKGGDVVGEVLKSLIDYTSTHFAAEERLMKMHSYPELESHRREHTQLVKQVLDIQQAMTEGRKPLTMNIMGFLKEWLVKHIQGDDRKYGSYLNSKGVA
jgi:hemerythrin